MKHLALFAALLMGVAAGSAHAAVSTTVNGRTAVSSIQIMAPGIGPSGNIYSADVTFEFSNVQNLSAACLNVTAAAMNAAQQAEVMSRMPAGVAIDSAFPIKITVSPDPSCNFSFADYVATEVHTSNLTYTANTPYRLYKAPVGGTYRDVTNDVLEGSIRARGRHGAFSEFVVVKDTVQDYANQASGRFFDLISEYSGFTSQAVAWNGANGGFALNSAQAAFNNGDYSGAVAQLKTFETFVGKNAGQYVPNQWQVGKTDTDNVAGDLASRSANLRFLMVRLGGTP